MSALVGMILLDEVVDPSSLFDDSFGPIEWSGNAGVLTYGTCTVGITVVDGQVRGEGVLQNVHPVLTEEEEFPAIGSHNAHLVVTTVGEKAAEIVTVHCGVVGKAMASEHAVAYHREGTTAGAQAVRQEIADDPKTNVLWSPVWVWEGENGVTGYTYGLKDLGLPELQIIDSQEPPVAVYVTLEQKARNMLAGEEVAGSDHAWLVDSETLARRVQI